MKVIGNGRTFRIYDDGMKTFECLPPATYAVRFSMMSGFSLEMKDDMSIGEDKIYGVHNAKVNKVLNGFNMSERNFGIILSGAKGIGKSLFARLVSKRVIEEGMPVIIVDENYSGLADFIESIQQPAMILFDEFEKVFRKKDEQEALLSMFDGTSNGRKLHVITCNNLSDLSDYLVNRPGRFHYHFQFDYPNADEVTEYMNDKLKDEYKGAIPDVVAFSAVVSLNYDCLRAIAFELNTGVSFSEAIADLNIMHIRHDKYNIRVQYKNGMVATARNISLNLFGDNEQHVYVDTANGNIGTIYIDPEFVVFNTSVGGYEIDGGSVRTWYDIGCAKDKPSEAEPEELDALAAEKAGIDKVIITASRRSFNTHYIV